MIALLKGFNHDFVDFLRRLEIVFHGKIELFRREVAVHLKESNFARVGKNSNRQIGLSIIVFSLVEVEDNGVFHLT